jgi:hypothetical protein
MFIIESSLYNRKVLSYIQQKFLAGKRDGNKSTAPIALDKGAVEAIGDLLGIIFSINGGIAIGIGQEYKIMTVQRMIM